MAEYIDRLDASTIPVLPVEQRVPFKTVDEAFEEGWRQALEMVAMMEPAADVAAVRHGMWLRTPTGWVYCSVCGEEPPEETNARTNYCPNCGAKMDLPEPPKEEKKI